MDIITVFFRTHLGEFGTSGPCWHL